MLDQENRSRRIELAQKRVHRLALCRGEPRHGQRHLELPLIPVRQIARVLMAQRHQSEVAEHRVRARHEIRRRHQRAKHAELCRVECLAGQEYILEDGEIREQPRDLKGPRDAACRALMGRQACHVFAEQDDSPSSRGDFTTDQIEERRLARPVGPDHGMALARANRQAHAIDCLQATEVPRDTLQRQARLCVLPTDLSDEVRRASAGVHREYSGCFR